MARDDDYREAFRLACQELAKVNLHRICSLSGAVCVEDKNGNPAISMVFLNRKHLIQFEPEVDVVLEGNGEPVPLPEKILILHYLLRARGESQQRNLITFRQVPEGPFYYSAFIQRALDPLARTFGADPQQLFDCGSELGAVTDELGDASITLKPLPRIPVSGGMLIRTQPQKATVGMEPSSHRSPRRLQHCRRPLPVHSQSCSPGRSIGSASRWSSPPARPAAGRLPSAAQPAQ